MSTLVKHTATLHWLDTSGQQHTERHAAWVASQATHLAYKRAKSLRLDGEAAAFRITHRQQVYA